MENDADILLYNTEWGEMNIKEELNRTIPSSPGAGCCFFNTATHHFQFYTGTKWVIAQETDV